jgi:DNA-binding response OmpR family regulator
MSRPFNTKQNMINKRILLIDTEKNVLSVYRTFLEGEGYEVDIAMDERSALEKISNETFAVVIAELYLKGKKTLDLLVHIREAHPEIYIVLVTATFLKSEGCEEVIEAGVDDYFTKPFSPHALLANIKKGLKRRDLVLKNIQLEEKLTLTPQSPFTESANTFANNVCDKHFFDLKLQNEITRAKRYKHPLSIIQFEIREPDNDKRFDQLDKGKISETLSSLLPKITRRTDVITQENGNFALMLVETAIEGAKNFSNRLKDEIVKTPLGQENQILDELMDLLTIEYHSFPDQADFFQKWSTTKV